MKKNINSKWLNYCPINVEPKITILSYKLKVFRSFFENTICKIGGKPVCINNIPIHKQKISAGSINTKKMRYANLMKLNRKQISNVIKTSVVENKDTILSSTVKNKRNTILLNENNKEFIKKENKSKKDRITNDENKFC